MRMRNYVIGMVTGTIICLATTLSFFYRMMNQQREQYGYLMENEWNKLIYCIIGIFLVLLIIQVGLTFHLVQKKEEQIDQSEEMLAQILEQAGDRKISEELWTQWKCSCEALQDQGAIGRLQERIWETAQIVRDREGVKQKEQTYLKDLMSDISHQLKTPLAALQVFVDIIEEEMSGQGKSKKELIEQIQKQITRMQWLVLGMLKLAQLESGILELNIKKESLNVTLKKSIDALKTKWQAKDVEIILKQHADKNGDILIDQDSDWLQEAYTNILKNAIEYAPEKSKIVITMEQTSLAVTVSIEDQGEGIPEKELPKIFNRFYCVHKKGQNKEGVGIGLALAKSIVESQGGMITVYSQTGIASYTKFITTFLTKS